MNYKFATLQAKYQHPKHESSKQFLTSLGPAFCSNWLFLNDQDFQHVYEPSEDSFLLIDALHLDVQFVQPTVVVEIGVGSGIVLASYAQILAAAGRDVKCFGVDINTQALEVAARLMKQNNIENVTLIESNLFSQLDIKFDVIIFNPPYVVTDSFELQQA